MTDSALVQLRRRRITPDTLQTELRGLQSRFDKILYCRRFYRENVIYRALVEGTADQINAELAEIYNADITPQTLHRMVIEYLITGECCYFVPTGQLLESERLSIEYDGSGDIKRVLYDEEFDISPDGLHVLAYKTKQSAARGEPPLFITLPWCMQVTTMMSAQTRAAELATRLLAKVVTIGPESDTGTEFDFEDDILILKTKNMADTIEFPKYQMPDFDKSINRLLRMICAVAGMPLEILFNDFTQTNFSQSKASYQSLRNEVQRYRRMFERYLSAIWPSVNIQWPEVVGADMLDIAKAQAYMSEVQNNE